MWRGRPPLRVGAAPPPHEGMKTRGEDAPQTRRRGRLRYAKYMRRNAGFSRQPRKPKATDIWRTRSRQGRAFLPAVIRHWEFVNHCALDILHFALFILHFYNPGSLPVLPSRLRWTKASAAATPASRPRKPAMISWC